MATLDVEEGRIVGRVAGDVLDDLTATQVRTLLDLASLYQPLDSDLTAIAALTTTAFGRGLLALADAAAARTAIDVDQAGTAASLVTAHTGDTSDAHDASAISVADAGSLFVATDVEAALAELTRLGSPSPYIGVWSNVTAYVAGDVVDRYDSGATAWKLYRALTANTNADPTSGSPWVEVTTPIFVTGTQEPLTAHAGATDDDGLGLPGPNAMVYLWQRAPGSPSAMAMRDKDSAGAPWVLMGGGWNVTLPATTTIDSVPVFSKFNEVSSDADGPEVAIGVEGQRSGAGDGDIDADVEGVRGGTGDGRARSRLTGQVTDAATGEALVVVRSLVTADAVADANLNVLAAVEDSAVGTSTINVSAEHQAGPVAALTFVAASGDASITHGSGKWAFNNATPQDQGGAIADASGGTTVDAEARTAINDLLAYLRLRGDIAT